MTPMKERCCRIDLGLAFTDTVLIGRMAVSHSEIGGAMEEEGPNPEIQMEGQEDLRRKLIMACRRLPLSAG